MQNERKVWATIFVILALPVLSTQTNEWHIIIAVNELRWLSQVGDYELDEWLVFRSMEVVHHACQEWQTGKKCSIPARSGTRIPSSYSLQPSYYAWATHLLHSFWVYVNSHFFVIIQNCCHQPVHIASFVIILKYLFWLQVSNCMFITKLMMNLIFMNGIFCSNSLGTSTHLMLSVSHLFHSLAKICPYCFILNNF
jgi:hypothetical protein